ncbi:MAG TPA: DUF2127 domain-containing protein [Spirochaetia bacterium]
MKEGATESAATRSSALHAGFEIGILLKGVYALLEVIGGILLRIVKPATLDGWLQFLAEAELAHDPHDILERVVEWVTQHVNLSAQHFGALYLMAHGGAKLILVSLLWSRKLWAYPLAIGVLFLFIVYQLVRWTATHSAFLLVISGFDAVMIWLTIVEYQRLRAMARPRTKE